MSGFNTDNSLSLIILRGSFSFVGFYGTGGSYTYTASDEYDPDFPLKALKNAIVHEYDRDSFWK